MPTITPKAGHGNPPPKHNRRQSDVVDDNPDAGHGNPPPDLVAPAPVPGQALPVSEAELQAGHGNPPPGIMQVPESAPSQQPAGDPLAQK